MAHFPFTSEDVAEKIRQAREYAGLGLPVFPLRPGQKRPLHKGWQREATTDARRIAELISVDPTCNLGLAMGSGLVAVDIDPAKGGEDALAALVAEHGATPRTATARTGGGGRHLLLRVDRPIGNRVEMCPGLDARGDGGLIAVAPSIHPSGVPYGWDIHPREGIARIPGWILALIRGPADILPREPKRKHASGPRPAREAILDLSMSEGADIDVDALAGLVDDLARRYAVTGPGRRNDLMNRGIASLLGRGLEPRVILAVVSAWHDRFGKLALTDSATARREAVACLASKLRSSTFSVGATAEDHAESCAKIELSGAVQAMIRSGRVAGNGSGGIEDQPPSPPLNAKSLRGIGGIDTRLCENRDDRFFVEAILVYALYKIRLGELDPADEARPLLMTNDSVRGIVSGRHGIPAWSDSKLERLRRCYIGRPSDRKPASRFELLRESSKGHKRPGGPAGVPSSYVATGVKQLLAMT